MYACVYHVNIIYLLGYFTVTLLLGCQLAVCSVRYALETFTHTHIANERLSPNIETTNKKKIFKYHATNARYFETRPLQQQLQRPYNIVAFRLRLAFSTSSYAASIIYLLHSMLCRTAPYLSADSLITVFNIK